MIEPKCHDLLNQLSDYIDGELDVSLCAELERHLDTCDNCQVVVDTLRHTVGLYRRYGQAKMPAGITERLWQALEQAGCLSKPS